MENQKKILVLGGTGAMGVYLVPELLRMGYRVDVVSLDDIKSDNPNLTYTVDSRERRLRRHRGLHDLFDRAVHQAVQAAA